MDVSNITLVSLLLTLNMFHIFIVFILLTSNGFMFAGLQITLFDFKIKIQHEKLKDHMTQFNKNDVTLTQFFSLVFICKALR